MSMRLALGAVLTLVLLGSASAAPRPAPASVQPLDCRGLTTPGLFPQTVVTSAVLVTKGTDTPAHCEVTATVSPVKASRIGVVLRLPNNWNGKILGLGGGGWAGNVTFQAATPGLIKGYAVIQTDGGHPGATAFDSAWAKDSPEAVTDFAWRAVHQMTVTGKTVVAKYYGKPQTRAYFQGCSTGGRMALMEAQRFPTDYNGIIAGAPVYNLTTQMNSVVRNNIFAAPDAQLTNAQLTVVTQSALRACDADDGIRDGVIGDPRTCKWDPIAIQCPTGAKSDQCLTPAQVAAVRKAYTPAATKRGAVAAYPLTRGGETGWSRFIATGAGTDMITTRQGVPGMRAFIFRDADFDLATFDAEKHQSMVRSTPFAKMYEADNPDLSPFIKGGGKLVMWHGWNDPGPSPYATADYFERVQKATGPRLGKQSLASSARFFLAPGVEHCGGGPGPDQFDLLGTLETWVEAGKAPDSLLASKRGSPISRPLCPYPQVAKFKGEGDPNDAKNFTCG